MSQPNPQSPPPTASAPPPPSVSEQVAVRLAKRARILDEGGQPYPVSVPRTQALAEVRAAWGGPIRGIVGVHGGEAEGFDLGGAGGCGVHGREPLLAACHG